MKSANRVAVAAALSFTSITLAQVASADANERQVVALADTGAVRWSVADVPLDSFAGRYIAEDGQEFSITIGDDNLTFEAPESWGLPVMTLSAQDGQSFASIDGSVRMTFAFTADGEVSGALVYRSVDPQAVATSRVPRRGIVTIFDSFDDAATARPLRRGVVTIYDVAEDVATSGIAIASAN